jgi:hypothetical protein
MSYIISNLLLLLYSKFGTRDNTSFAFNCDQNHFILVTCDNMYTMKLKDELVFVDFFFHPIAFVICD